MKVSALVIVSAFALIAQSVIAQQLDVTTSFGNLFSSDLFFNTPFIRVNKIKSIRSKYSTKQELQPIIDTKLFQQYDFDTLGRLVRHLDAFYRTGKEPDTLVLYYSYDNTGRLEYKRISDAFGFYSYHNEYDKEGNLLKQTYSRDDNSTASKANFRLEKQYIIISESYTYQRPAQTHLLRITFNEYGKEFKEDRYTSNKFGNRIEHISRYIITDRGAKTVFRYNEKNRLGEKIEFSNLEERDSTVTTFTYDEIGNIGEQKISRNTKLKTTIQYLYDSKNLLLSARLIKDEATSLISIYKYTYEFY